MQRRRRHLVDLSLAVRPRGFGDFPWHPYQHLRLFGVERRARLWGQCVLEYLQHRGSASGGGGLRRAAATAPACALARKRAGGDPGPRPAGQRLHNCRYIAWRSQTCGSPAGWARAGKGGVLLLQEGALQVPFRFLRLDQRPSLGHRYGIIFETGNSDCAARLWPNSSPVPIAARSTISTCLKCCSPSARNFCDRSNSSHRARGSRRRAIAGSNPAAGSWVRGPARQGPNGSRLAPAPDQILRVFVETGIRSTKGHRRYGKIAQIASLVRGSICPAQMCTMPPSDRPEANIVGYYLFFEVNRCIAPVQMTALRGSREQVRALAAR